MPFNAPLAVDTVPLPSFRPPRHTALARRCMDILEQGNQTPTLMFAQAAHPRRLGSGGGRPEDEMAVAEFVPEVPVSDGLGIGVPDPVHSEERREEGQMARDGIVEPGEEAVDRVHPSVRIDEEAGEAGDGTHPPPGADGLPGADDR